jgi:hypothetical protein
LIDPVAALVEKIRSAQIPEDWTVVVGLRAGTVLAVVAVAGATVLVGATVVVVEGTVVVGGRVTGAAAAAESPRAGGVVVDVAPWWVLAQPAPSPATPPNTRSPTAARHDLVACIKFAPSVQLPIRGCPVRT